MTALAALLLAAVDPFGSAAALELTYSGRLTPVAVSDPKAGEKGFAVTWLLTRREGKGADAAFVTTEENAALPWPARFGFGLPDGEHGPRIGYRFDEKGHVVPLPGAILKDADRLAPGGELIDGPLKLTVTDERTVAGRECRIVEISTNFGREKTVAVEKSTGLIVRHEETVFLGRGDRFALVLELAEATPLDAATSAGRQAIMERLRKIADAAGQGERDPAADLPAPALDQIAALAAPLAGSAAGTPFDDLAATIARDVAEQKLRAEGIAGLVKKAVGSPAPPLELKGLDGKPIDPATFKDKVVILHFWEYDNGTLAAPYGQVGYLDFLSRKRAKAGIAVTGVAVNPAFGDPEARGRAGRGAKNLAAFMNLGFPIAADDGTLLRAFGDPRPIGAALPLWVVIGPDGVVKSYKAGLYDIEPNEGLKELDAEVVHLLRERK